MKKCGECGKIFEPALPFGEVDCSFECRQKKQRRTLRLSNRKRWEREKELIKKERERIKLL